MALRNAGSPRLPPLQHNGEMPAEGLALQTAPERGATPEEEDYFPGSAPTDAPLTAPPSMAQKYAAKKERLRLQLEARKARMKALANNMSGCFPSEAAVDLAVARSAAIATRPPPHAQSPAVTHKELLPPAGAGGRSGWWWQRCSACWCPSLCPGPR